MPKPDRTRCGAVLVLVTMVAVALPLLARSPALAVAAATEPAADLAEVTTTTTTIITTPRPSIAPPSPPSGAQGFRPLTPVRLLDTRTTGKPAGAGEVRSITIPTQDGRTPTAVALNVTVTEPTGLGYATVYPCGAERPLASNLNYVAGQTVPNAVHVAVGTSRKVCVFVTTPTHLVVDLNGWWGTGGGSGFGALTPQRVLDTRKAKQRLEAGKVLEVEVAGVGDSPRQWTTAAVLNVTVTEPLAPGYVTVWPCGATRPVASNLNYVAGQTVPNVVTTGVGTGGKVCFYSWASTHLVVDVTGWYGPVGLGWFEPRSPVRLVDTRDEEGRVTLDAPLEVSVGDASAVALNVTATEGAKAGYVTVWPCGTERPLASNLNYLAGQTVPNAVVVGAGEGGKVCLASSAPAHLVVDLNGELTAKLPTGEPVDLDLLAVVQFGFTQWSAGYASLNPYRFGDSKYGKAWDCAPGETECGKVDMYGKRRMGRPGDFFYDCSGLMVAAWLRGGIDLVKLNAGWSDVMYKYLPRVPMDQARQGDLLLFGEGERNPSDPTTHVGLLVGDDLMLHSGSCRGVSAVCLTSVSWSRVVAVARPTLTAPRLGGLLETTDGELLDPVRAALSVAEDDVEE